MDMQLVILMLAWGLMVGLVFSSIGAAGGILTSFGLITFAGLDDPNMVKPMAQIVVLIAALVFVPGYFRRKGLVWPLGVLLGIGGLAGAWLGSTLSTHYLSDMNQFKPWFGVLTLLVALKIGFEFLRRDKIPAAGQDKAVCDGVSNLHFGATALDFDFCDRHYHIAHLKPLLAGFIISCVAAVFGVGGGFLLVPFMASILMMPMHIIPATAAIAIFMSLIMSISTYIRLGAEIDWKLLVPLSIGTILGALFGQKLNRNMKNSWLQIALGVIVLAIGLKYILA